MSGCQKRSNRKKTLLESFIECFCLRRKEHVRTTNGLPVKTGRACPASADGRGFTRDRIDYPAVCGLEHPQGAARVVRSGTGSKRFCDSANDEYHREQSGRGRVACTPTSP